MSLSPIAGSDYNLLLAELQLRVENWKGHRLDSFGRLLLHDTLRVSIDGLSRHTGRPYEARKVSIIHLLEGNYQG
jgi:hypothetical protein